MKKGEEDTTRVDGKKVDRKVGEAFKSYVMKKHGRIRGVYSDEITKALAMYLEVEGRPVGNLERDNSARSKYKALNKRIDEEAKEIDEYERAIDMLNEDMRNDVDWLESQLEKVKKTNEKFSQRVTEHEAHEYNESQEV